MKRYLAIAEKPSLCRDIRNCYLNHQKEIEVKVGKIDFVALSGHVCTWWEPNDYEAWDGKWEEINYPMLPKDWKVKAIKGNRETEILRGIKEKAGNYDGLINCCDSDTEGYGIFWLLTNYLHLENMPALRFLEHSLTDKEIFESLMSMTPISELEHQRAVKAFLLRSKADWLYGMNATRMMTVKTGELMAVGRVKAPTIKIVYDNSMAIENFRPERYLQITADYGTFSAVLSDASGIPLRLQKPVQNIPLQGEVYLRESKEESVHAPRLYDLSAIQAEAGQTYGYTPLKVLELVQSLYEEHKLLSYPRTQCRYVSLEKAKEFPVMLQASAVFDDLAPYVQRLTQQDYERVYEDRMVVNDAEVGKEAHDAILPTDKAPDLSVLTEDELRILHLVHQRLLAQFLHPLKQEKSKLIFRHGEHCFAAKGKIVTDLGWRSLYGALRDIEIPDLQKGDPVCAKQFQTQLKETKPPKRITQPNLITAMKNIGNLVEDKELKRILAESQGIGTTATRASIIKDIIDRGYIRDHRGLYITEMGKRYVEGLQGIDILDPVFTAFLDLDIKRIQRGEAEYEEQYQKMLKDLRKTCQQIEQMAAKNTVNVKCPHCGELLRIQKYSYTCQECKFKVPRVLCGVPITEEMLVDPENLAKKRKFTSKAGKQFSAGLVMTEKGLEFVF